LERRRGRERCHPDIVVEDVDLAHVAGHSIQPNLQAQSLRVLGRVERERPKGPNERAREQHRGAHRAGDARERAPTEKGRGSSESLRAGDRGIGQVAPLARRRARLNALTHGAAFALGLTRRYPTISRCRAEQNSVQYIGNMPGSSALNVTFSCLPGSRLRCTFDIAIVNPCVWSSACSRFVMCRLTVSPSSTSIRSGLKWLRTADM